MSDDRSRMAPPAPRRMMHQRKVHCDAFLREDGLWEVEAHLRDTKTFPYIHFSLGPLEPGAAIHDIVLRLTVNDDLVVVAVDGEMRQSPVFACQDVLGGLQSLVGIRLVAGWRKLARERIERTHTCTHLMDLMVPAITTLYQTIGMGKTPEGRNALDDARQRGERPFYLGGCYSWREDGPLTRQHFPAFATGGGEEG